MTLSIIIVNWNSKDYVRKCLETIQAHCRRTDVEVVVVDGASFDGCGEMLAEHFPSTVFIQSSANVGFAKANNLAATHARGEFLLFLNPDTEFTEDSASILLDQMRQHPEIGALGCTLLNTDGTLQTSCVQAFPTVLNQALDSEVLRRFFPRAGLWGMRPLLDSPSSPQPVEVISGACILMRKATFQRIGGFTERYFMYGEDVDLCYKLRTSGTTAAYTAATKIIHHGGGSSRKSVSNFSNVMMRESIHRFLRTHRGAGSALLYRAVMLVTSVIRLTAIGPLMLLSSRRVVQHGSASFGKWKCILRWSFGLEAWARST